MSNDRTLAIGMLLACAISFVVGMMFTQGGSSQVMVVTTVNPDSTSQAMIADSVQMQQTYSSGGIETQVSQEINEQFYEAQATMNVEFRTAIANGEGGIYQRILMQLKAEGLVVGDTPTPVPDKPTEY